MDKRPLYRKLLGYFLQGLVLTIPISVTLYVLVTLIRFIDNLIPVNIPGLGLLTILAAITLVGLLGSTIIAQPILKYFQGILDRAPLIKTVYSAIKDLVTAFVGSKKRFDQPVLVRLSMDTDLEKPGFITQEDLSVLGLGKDKVAVYLPHSYNFSGNLFIVPVSNIRPLDVSSSELMKFIVSGGVTTLSPREKEEEPE